MILFANFDRQHAYETVLGLLASQQPVTYFAGSYHIFGSFGARLAKNLGLRGDTLPSELRHTHGVTIKTFCFRDRLRFRNLRNFSAKHEQFDRWTAAHVKAWAPRITAIYCYQDYLHHTVQTAAAHGIPVICEQIIDNSPAVHLTLQREMKRAGLSISLKSERQNLEIIRRSSVAVVPTQAIRKYIYENFPEKPLVVAPYGVTATNAAIASSRKTRPENYIVVRANSVRKGSLIILAALRQLVEAGKWPFEVKLIFAGALDEMSGVAAKDLTARGVNLHARDFRHAELMDLLPSSRAFIMPSLQEGRSLLALEAANFGVPLFLSDHVGLEEPSLETLAVFVRQDTPEAWAAVLHSFLTGRLSRDDLSAGALEIARQNPWSHYHDGVARAMACVRREANDPAKKIHANV